MPSKLKRLPNNSYTIILKFEEEADKTECLNSKEYKEIIGKLASSIGINYNCKIQYITLD